MKPDDQSNEPLNRVRRRDRAVEDEAWIRAFLTRAPFGVLATTRADQPSMNPMHFVFDAAQPALYVHTGKRGRLNENLALNSKVCFCAAEMGRLLPGKRAGEFSGEYASVIVFGRAEVVSDETEAGRALQALLDKYFPEHEPTRDYEPITATDLSVTCVLRISIDAWSGKRNQKPPDHPGAFEYQPV